MRIRRISVQDYRGFAGSHTLDFNAKCKNALIYGENGSGKSSLFAAIRDFLACSRVEQAIRASQNRFVAAAEPDIRIEIEGEDDSGNRLPASGPYEWNETSSPLGQDVIEETAKSHVCLDYRDLLLTHFVHRDSEDVDLFDIIALRVLGQFPNPITGRTFAGDWADLQRKPPYPSWVHLFADYQRLLGDFNNGLRATLVDLEAKSNELLRLFDNRLVVRLSYSSAELVESPRRTAEGKVKVTTELFDGPFQKHHVSLNEARLSSLGICLYLASLLLLPTPRLKVLVLDDILIGLDMGNRFPVLKILETYFRDWQIVLLTHDYIWYNMIRLNYDAGSWAIFEMYSERDPEGTYDRPVVMAKAAGWDGLLKEAEGHVTANDPRASAVYARAAFECWVKKVADSRGNVTVTYKADPAQLGCDPIWKALVASYGPLDPKQVAAERGIETYRKVVLNPWSHGAGANVTLGEVRQAIAAIREATARFPKRA